MQQKAALNLFIQPAWGRTACNNHIENFERLGLADKDPLPLIRALLAITASPGYLPAKESILMLATTAETDGDVGSLQANQPCNRGHASFVLAFCFLCEETR